MGNVLPLIALALIYFGSFYQCANCHLANQVFFIAESNILAIQKRRMRSTIHKMLIHHNILLVMDTKQEKIVQQIICLLST